MKIETRIPGFYIRQAEREDVGLILKFIRHIADYEKLSHEVVANEKSLEKYLFSGSRIAEVIFGEYMGETVAFAVYFHNFSTFTGRPGLYLEDIFVLENMRGKGFGTVMLKYLARLARERNCARFEWTVLDWNKPSIDFYRSLGADLKKEWIINRMTGAALENLASEF